MTVMPGKERQNAYMTRTHPVGEEVCGANLCHLSFADYSAPKEQAGTTAKSAFSFFECTKHMAEVGRYIDDVLKNYRA